MAVAVVATLTACSGGASTPAVPQEIALTQALTTDLANYLNARSSVEHISTLSLAVTFRGSAAPITATVGTTRYAGGQAVTAASLFQIGSITKSFTSALILRLEAAGKLSINDTVGKWLPQFPAWSTVTIRQLLDMTSGIPTYDGTAQWEADYSANPLDESTAAQLIGYAYPTIKAPGAAFSYSNTGYILAQLIIEAASPSHDYTTEINRLIASSGLSNTSYAPYFPAPAVAARLVAGYEVNTDDPGLAALLGQDTSGFSLGWAQAAGAIISDPSDTAAWVRALFEGNVLPRKQLAELESLVSTKDGQPIPRSTLNHPGFGLGVFEITVPTEGTFWGYQGSTIGYRATYEYLTTSGTIISVFTNSQTSAAKNIINDVLFPQLFTTLKAFGKV